MRRPLLLALLLLAMLSSAQSGREVEITAEPHHHLALKNSYVRVFKVEVPPHQATLMHRHPYDYAYVTIGPVELSNAVQGKPPATLKLQDGETRFSPGSFSHAVRVLSDTPFRNLTIELLKTSGNGQSDAGGWTDQRGLQILDGGTDEIVFVKDDVRASDVQLNPRGTLPRTQAAAAELIVAVSDILLQTAPGHRRKDEIRLSAGDIRWLRPARTVVNAGTQSARFICFEFH